MQYDAGQMAVGSTLLVALKNVLYHVVCLGNERRYFTLKSHGVLMAARLGLYETAYLKLLPAFIRPGSDVIDVGANIGTYTRAMAGLVGTGGRVFAFEPIAATAEILAATCQPLTNVLIVREALSDRTRDEVELRVPLLAGSVPEPALAAVHPRSPAEGDLQTWRTFRVPVRRLDDHLERFRDISFIKVDVEGHEAAFLSGAAEAIRRFRPVLQLETSGLRGEAAMLHRWTRAARYALLIVRHGRLELALPEALRGLNAYAVPQEMLAQLPKELLHERHAA